MTIVHLVCLPIKHRTCQSTVRHNEKTSHSSKTKHVSLKIHEISRLRHVEERHLRRSPRTSPRGERQAGGRLSNPLDSLVCIFRLPVTSCWHRDRSFRLKSYRGRRLWLARLARSAGRAGAGWWNWRIVTGNRSPRFPCSPRARRGI